MDDVNLYFKETKFGHFCLIEHDMISNVINHQDSWESHLFYLYSQIIKEDSVCLDGGANIGFHTVQFARLANKGKVYAFEPQPLIYNVLTTNVLINGLSPIVEQHRLGLSDSVSKQRFSEMNHPGVHMSDTCINYGGRGFVDLIGEGEDEATTVAIDSFNIEKLDFIKLDIQGFEYKALIGGMETIKNNKPTIFIENYAHMPSNINIEQEKASIDLLLNLGYTGYRLGIGNEDDCIFTIDKNVMDIIEKGPFPFKNISL